MEKAAKDGGSASALLRAHIEDYLAGGKSRRMQFRTWQPVTVPVAAAIILWCAYGLSSSAPANQGRRPEFQALDKNGDGILDRREYVNQFELVSLRSDSDRQTLVAKFKASMSSLKASGELRGYFGEQDSNRDGEVSYPEFVSFKERFARRSFAAADENSDRRISFPEFEATIGVENNLQVYGAFIRRDRDRNGFLNEEEFRGGAFSLRVSEDSDV